VKKMVWAVGVVVAVGIIVLAIEAQNKNIPMFVAGSACTPSNTTDQITLSGGTSPKAHPDQACVYPGDTITWTGEQGVPWRLHFDDAIFEAVNPTHPGNVDITNGASGNFQVGTGTLFQNLNSGVSYSYSGQYGNHPLEPKIIVMPTGSFKQCLDRALYVLLSKFLKR